MIACPAHPQHGAHRYRLPPEGVAGPGVCTYCSAQKTFVPRRRTLWWQTTPGRSNAAATQSQGERDATAEARP